MDLPSVWIRSQQYAHLQSTAVAAWRKFPKDVQTTIHDSPYVSCVQVFSFVILLRSISAVHSVIFNMLAEDGKKLREKSFGLNGQRYNAIL